MQDSMLSGLRPDDANTSTRLHKTLVARSNGMTVPDRRIMSGVRSYTVEHPMHEKHGDHVWHGTGRPHAGG